MSEAGKNQNRPATAAGLSEHIGGLIGIAAEGVPYSAGLAVAGLVLLGLDLPWLGMFVLIAAVAVGSFFRDPERTPAGGEESVVASADGMVTDVSETAFPDGIEEGRWWRVSVFMSPLNVHVNRAPAAGEITAVRHTAGEFRAAFRDQASEHNERNLIMMTGRDGRRLAIMQVAGYLARRIVCKTRAGERVTRGQRVGLIMFGSRVDHFMPLHYRVAVRPGDRVRAGESVIAEPNR